MEQLLNFISTHRFWVRNKPAEMMLLAYFVSSLILFVLYIAGNWNVISLQNAALLFLLFIILMSTHYGMLLSIHIAVAVENKNFFMYYISLILIAGLIYWLDAILYNKITFYLDWGVDLTASTQMPEIEMANMQAGTKQKPKIERTQEQQFVYAWGDVIWTAIFLKNLLLLGSAFVSAMDEKNKSIHVDLRRVRPERIMLEQKIEPQKLNAFQSTILQIAGVKAVMDEKEKA